MITTNITCVQFVINFIWSSGVGLQAYGSIQSILVVYCEKIVKMPKKTKLCCALGEHNSGAMELWSALGCATSITGFLIC